MFRRYLKMRNSRIILHSIEKSVNKSQDSNLNTHSTSQRNDHIDATIYDFEQALGGAKDITASSSHV